MVMLLKRSLLSLPIVLLLALLLTTPVLAAIAQPTSITISGVYVYRNCKETGDQLYLIDYTIEYPAEGNPDETITEIYICRLMDGAAEIRGVAPYAYFNDGYDRGVIAIYFDAGSAPPWEGDYTMELVGNPLMEWVGGDFPSSIVTTFNLWQDNSLSVTHTVLSSRILYLADALEIAWSVDMILSTSGGSSLTAYGEDYFTNVVPYLAEIAPYALAGQIILPEVDEVDTSTEYADDLEAGIIDTLFDLTPLAEKIGTTRAVLTTILYYAMVVVFLALIARKLKTTKPIMLFALPLVIGGAFVGVPLLVTVLVGFLNVAFIGWSLLYKPSQA